VTVFSSLNNADILVTGHTGFTGSWVCHALKSLGARVHGLALPPATNPAMFTLTEVEGLLESHILGDIADNALVLETVQRLQPRAILHLAAQPLVLASYADPVGSFRTNALGTVHILEAARLTPSVQGVVAITTDKVYANEGLGLPFTEDAPLGGHDPYAASKAAAEMAIMGYRASLDSWQRTMVIETARGGNIIGGGDWSANRLIPDYVRAVASGKPLPIRHPHATRPWQHVLSLVHGYFLLLERILSSTETGAGEAWNFGPDPNDCLFVEAMVQKLSACWQKVDLPAAAPKLHEATTLVIDSTKAKQRLGWESRLSLDDAISATVDWYQTALTAPENLSALTQNQIAAYFARL
jgi:CDP-glucose 4,6-dehydratase